MQGAWVLSLVGEDPTCCVAWPKTTKKERRGVEIDKLEDEDFKSEGIFMEGLGSVHLWAKGRAGQSFIECKGAGPAHWVSSYASVPNPPSPKADHAPLATFI